MANELFHFGKYLINEGCLSWLRDTVRAMLIDTAVDTPGPATDHAFSDLLAGSRVGDSGGSSQASMPSLASKTNSVVGGYSVLDAADTVFTTVPVGAPLNRLLLFKECLPEVGATEGVTFGAPSGGVQTVTVTSALLAVTHERGLLRLPAGTQNVGNTGDFLIVKWISTTQVQILNPGGVAEGPIAGVVWSTQAPLLALYNTAPDTVGLPVTPNGGNISVAWDNGANKIWRM